MNQRMLKFLFIFFTSVLAVSQVHAQLQKITFDLQKDKPKKFENRTLQSEKTGETKFTLPRRFMQNTTSHYNFYFNAQTKVTNVIERARLSQKDNFNQLLPYYSYSLENTANQKTELDSVIYKATAGILLHDLRSDWVDDLYLLIGQAYYLRREFDSAAITFQFINYNLFPRTKKSDDQIVIGTNNNSLNTLSVSSKEDRGFFKKMFTRPPRRNDALVWQIRTWIDMGEYADAAGLINTLKNDPLFPERLNPYFAEVQGYWFFQQHMYDSAIVYIENALSNAIDIEDKARREFLLAQLYERNGQLEEASDYYDKSIKHTTDPLLDIYANLNKAKMLRSDDPEEITRSIDRLIKMSKKYKFEPYRDVIFNSAGQLALEIPDTLSAISFLQSSTFFSGKNLPLKNKSFLQLAEISYLQKKYKDAYAYYDSIKTDDISLKNIDQIKERKEALSKIVKYILIIEREDSLQTIAKLSSADRDALIKKLSKKLQKERGISDEEMEYTNSSNTFFDAKNASGDIFYNNNLKGDWYFYNSSAKEKGFADFKRNWGKRDNVDNWRRIKSGGLNSISNPTEKKGNFLTPKKRPPSNYNSDPMVEIVDEDNLDAEDFLSSNIDNKQEDISVAGLLANVPLTQSMLDSSNTKISYSLFQLGKNYQNLLEEYPMAIVTYEESLQRFPDSLYDGELYMNLSYCYGKIGNKAKADFYKNQLLNNYKNSKFADYLIHPEKFNPTKNNPAATQRYEQIYTLFIEGKFKEALEEKQKADSLYGNTFWNPQLLYIEAVYHVQKKEDSIAINVLNQIVKLYPNEPLREKAAIMIDVVKRRKSIENYLTKLEIKRVEEAPELSVFDDTKIEKETLKEKTIPQVVKKDDKVVTQQIEINAEKQKPTPISNATFTFDTFKPQYVMMILDKVDPVYINEAKNAFTRYNRSNFYSDHIEIIRDTLNSEKTILLFSPFVAAETAIAYRDRIKKDAPREISWLPANKYSFIIISAANLELLKSNQKLEDYINLLNEKYPGKF